MGSYDALFNNNSFLIFLGAKDDEKHLKYNLVNIFILSFNY